MTHKPDTLDGIVAEMRAATDGASDETVADWADRIARLAPAAASGWREIESAPKDGRDILASRSGIKPYVAAFVGGEWVDTRTGYATWRDPTHWMPLPEPPR